MISQVTTPETFEFDAVDEVVADVAAGKIVIVTDDADRENEGDLVMAAEKVTAASVNFMAMHGRGKSRNVFDRFHRLSRCRGRRDDWHQRA